MPDFKHIVRNVSIYNILPPSLTTLGTTHSGDASDPNSSSSDISERLNSHVNKQVKLFEGDMIINEKMVTLNSSSMDFPRTTMSISFKHENSDIVFCKTCDIDNIAKYDEIIDKIYTKPLKNKPSVNKYRIIIELEHSGTNKRIPLEIRITDPREQFKVTDIFVRIKDEFELIEDMYYM